MKKFIAAALSILVGAFGYTIAETSIDSRVANLEAECSSLKSVVSELCELHNITTNETTTKDDTTTSIEVAVPVSVSDILAVYNNACEKVFSEKPSYTKTVVTELHNLELGAIGKLDMVRDAIGNFLGEGTETLTVSQGTPSNELVKSALSGSDISVASCKLSENGKYYEIEITVKSETNPLKSNSSLNKFTDDYKDVNEMHTALQSEGASAETINCTSKDVKIIAEISVADKSFHSLTHKFKLDTVLETVNFVLTLKQGTGTIYTTVNYSSFNY